MHNIYNLKEVLCNELEEYGKKGDLSAGNLDVIDKLAHTIKNLDKIIEAKEDEEYSGAYYDGRSYEGNYRDGRRYSRNDGRSYARGRGRNARRDSMGRYASEGYSRNDYSMDMAEQLRDMMQDAPDEQTRQEIQRLVKKMEQM